MTPLAHTALREMLRARTEVAITRAANLATATCFDLSPIAELVSDTVRGLGDAMTQPLERSPIDHGGLVFAPAPRFWLEQRGGEIARGALVHTIPCDTGSALYWQGYQRPACASDMAGFLTEVRNEATGEPAVWSRFTPPDGLSPELAPSTPQAWREHALWVIACLLAVNAPRGFSREEQPVHRGLLREARAAGVPEIRVGYTIRLDIQRAPAGCRSTEPRHRQGLHFVRSHRRQLGPQRTAQVRAHWKGDASYGILLGDRLVKGGGRR